jgi:hypothetical protein
MKSERSFIQELEQKAKEQQKLANTEMIPEWAKGVGDWLVVNPWRVLIPVAGMSYLVIRMIYGLEFREFILGLFGGFR